MYCKIWNTQKVLLACFSVDPFAIHVKDPLYWHSTIILWCIGAESEFLDQNLRLVS